jgi:hypothetical protein
MTLAKPERSSLRTGAPLRASLLALLLAAALWGCMALPTTTAPPTGVATPTPVPAETVTTDATPPSEPPVPALSVDHPTVEVTPATALRDGQTVRVNVDGFGVGGKVLISECSTRAAASGEGCGPELAEQLFLVTGDDRSGTTSFVVTADAPIGPLTTSTRRCTTDCVIVASLGAGLPFVVAPISFAGSSGILMVGVGEQVQPALPSEELKQAFSDAIEQAEANSLDLGFPSYDR